MASLFMVWAKKISNFPGNLTSTCRWASASRQLWPALLYWAIYSHPRVGWTPYNIKYVIVCRLERLKVTVKWVFENVFVFVGVIFLI